MPRRTKSYYLVPDVPKLRRLMDERRFTARRLAAKAGLHPNTIGNVLAGRHVPTTTTLQMIAVVFGKPYTALLKKEEEG